MKCEDILKKAGLSAEDVKKVSDDIQTRISEGDDFQSILKQINQDLPDIDFTTRMAAVSAVKKVSTLKEMRRRVFDDNKYIRNFKAFLTGSTRKKEGFLYSIGTMQRAKLKTMHGKIFAETGLSSRALRRILQSRAFQRDLVKELYPFDGKMKTGNKIAFQMAKSIVDAKQRIILDLNRSGVAVRYRADHVATQWHDPYRMAKANKDQWIKDVRGLIDWEKTKLKNVPKKVIAPGVVLPGHKMTIDEYLGKVFDGRTKASKQYDTSKFRMSEAVGEQFEHGRELIFKDSDSWLQYNELYGHQSPIHAIFNDLEVQTNRSVLMDFMGPNPHETFQTMVDEIKTKLKSEGKEMSAWEENGFRARFAHLTGEAFIIGKPGLAKFVNFISGLNILSKLGKAALSSLTDMATASMTLNHMGVHGFSAYTGMLKNLGRQIPEAERKYVYRMLGVGADSILGSAASRFTIYDALPGMMSDAVDKFFVRNGLNAWTDWSREAFSAMSSMHFSKNLRTGWNNLDGNFKRVVEQYGINEKDWGRLQEIGSFKISDLVKNEPDLKGTNFPDERFITPDWVLQNGTAADSRLSDKLSLFFVNESRIGVPEIGVGDRAMMMRTFQRGTIPGAAAQGFMQFRTYQVAMWNNLAPRMYEMGIKSSTYHTLGAMGFGYASLSLKDLAAGKTRRPLDDPRTYFDMLRQSGVLGFMGDGLAAEYGTYYGKLDEEILGTHYSTYKDFATMFAGMMSDDVTAWEAWKALKSNTPYANLFYTEWAYNYFIDWQVREHLNPGSLQRLENWYKYDRDQEYIDIGLPFVSPWGDPSEFVREGGPRHMGDVISTLVR
mgnify:FL=1